ncbi:dCTP deaminase [Bacillus sp. FJAT-44742]|uniref:dCTP deaminase n=1 Tax=Bacillus sp. FJAT-44742 TaxID=2014005 RepID=UPI000C23251D|nr:dCTP deaminase [Bacillus sp. FJAT-44742]
MLSDKQLDALARSDKFVNPYNPDNCEGATIDLTLDNLIKEYVSDEPIIMGKEVTEDHYKSIDLTKDDYMLQPKQSVLVQTSEFIKVPEDKSARIYERYSVKSLGLIISPAHYMNPGYRGKISLLAFNSTNTPIKLVPGIKCCQIGLFELGTKPWKPYEKQDAKYMDSENVSISKLHLDSEIQDFLRIKGVSEVSDRVAGDLGNYLMGQIKSTANDLADLGIKQWEERHSK